jgi:hypothetical protein
MPAMQFGLSFRLSKPTWSSSLFAAGSAWPKDRWFASAGIRRESFILYFVGHVHFIFKGLGMNLRVWSI